jgi:hypothetical protein
MNGMVGEHADHRITWNITAQVEQEVIGVNLGGQFGPEIELSPKQTVLDYDSGDFFWCEDCNIGVYPEDFLGTDEQWQLV